MSVGREWSVVIPVRDEADLVSVCLHGCLALNPGEVIVCTDKPSNRRVLQAINYARRKYPYSSTAVTVLEVPYDPSFKFHQAHVRRAGFLAARFQKILTLDADDVPNRQVFRALELIGRENVGLASVAKFHYPIGIARFWRTLAMSLVRFASKVIRHRFLYWFTGVYCLYKPFWLQTDDLERVRAIDNPKSGTLNNRKATFGEDTHLHLSMDKKFRSVAVPTIGAVSLRDQHEDDPRMQYQRGYHMGKDHPEAFRWMAIELLVMAHPHYVRGFLSGRRSRIE